MNRRSFLKFLAAIPVIRHVPIIREPSLPGSRRISAAEWLRTPSGGGGGGGGGAGGLVFIIKSGAGITVTANGGNGAKKVGDV